MEIPKGLKYSKEHEWVAVEDTVATIGITDHAQEQLGEITVRLARRLGYCAADEAEIHREIQRWISPRLAVRFEYVQELERQPNGKFRAVLSRLKSPPQSSVAEQVHL